MDNYVKGLHCELINALRMEFWLDGEDPSGDSQVVVDFRTSSELCPLISFNELSDGVDLDSMKAIIEKVEKYKEKLEKFEADFENA